MLNCQIHQSLSLDLISRDLQTFEISGKLLQFD